MADLIALVNAIALAAEPVGAAGAQRLVRLGPARPPTGRRGG
ncbi:hypothetical protein [Micromonospora endophytica]